MIAQLRDVDLVRERAAIERFDVLHENSEVDPLEIDTAVDDRIEHEAVVGAR